MINRQAHARAICRRVTAKINDFSPVGLGHWDQTWKQVEGPTDRFLDALARWVEHDTPMTRDDVTTATEALLVAWWEVAQLFQLLEGSPARQEGVDHAHV